jgi:hypothetical protein
MEAVREVERQRGDNHDDQEEQLKVHGLNSCAGSVAMSKRSARIPWQKLTDGEVFGYR